MELFDSACAHDGRRDDGLREEPGKCRLRRSEAAAASHFLELGQDSPAPVVKVTVADALKPRALRLAAALILAGKEPGGKWAVRDYADALLLAQRLEFTLELDRGGPGYSAAGVRYSAPGCVCR